MTPLINSTDRIFIAGHRGMKAAPSVEHLRKLVMVNFLQQVEKSLTFSMALLLKLGFHKTNLQS